MEKRWGPKTTAAARKQIEVIDNFLVSVLCGAWSTSHTTAVGTGQLCEGQTALVWSSTKKIVTHWPGTQRATLGVVTRDNILQH